MSKIEYNSNYFKLTYTIENNATHETIPFDYYYDTYALTFIIKGEGTCSVEGNTYTISDGDIIILSPDEIRSFKFKDAEYHERLSIYFCNAILSPFLEYDLPLMNVFRCRQLGLGNKYSINSFDSKRVMNIMEQIKSFVKKPVESINTARLHALIIQILFWLYDFSNFSKPYYVSKLKDTIVFETCEYIKKNLEKDLSMKSLQQKLFVSRYQLTKVFIRNMGITLTEYIERKRLNRVISLVANGEKIESASFQAGFNSYSNFYKKFIKYYGISPYKFFINASKK